MRRVESWVVQRYEISLQTYLQAIMYYFVYIFINIPIIKLLIIFQRFSKCCSKVMRAFPNIFRTFLKISEDFPNVVWKSCERFRTLSELFWRFPKIFQMLSESHVNVSEHYLNFSEDFQRFSKCCLKVIRAFPNIFRTFLKISEDYWHLLKISKEDPNITHSAIIETKSWQTCLQQMHYRYLYMKDLIQIDPCNSLLTSSYNISVYTG